MVGWKLLIEVVVADPSGELSVGKLAALFRNPKEAIHAAVGHSGRSQLAQSSFRTIT